jgi:hypothetical protein
MAKFTRKKKEEATSAQLVVMHALCKALHHSGKLAKENVGLMAKDEAEAVKQLLPKVNNFIAVFDKIFAKDPEAKKFVKGQFSAIDEFSMQILEAVDQVLSKPTTTL